ncbi:MAG: hypothetical protein B7Y36_13715 [Novosphingobium sp. 28-62-57]|nr:MAG: hypothetical protein B7Y36_13715 [Novosphingobium sp. 28-62-57]
MRRIARGPINVTNRHQDPFVSSPSTACLWQALRINFGQSAEVETLARGLSTSLEANGGRES